MDKVDEFDFITQFIQAFAMDIEESRKQLRSLWTAFCLHQWLEHEDDECSVLMSKMWDTADDSDRRAFGSFGAFCGYLGAELL